MLEETCANQAFNAQDGSLLSWDHFLHELARWYGISEVCGPSQNDQDYHVLRMAGGKYCPMGYGPQLEVGRTYAIDEWGHSGENAAAWNKLMDASGGRLVKNPIESDGPRDMWLGDFAYTPFGTLNDEQSQAIRIQRVRR